MSLEALVQSVAGYFEGLARGVFDGDPASNQNLTVEVLGASRALDTPVMIVITPWTVTGMVFPPDGLFLTGLRIEHRHYPVLANEVDGIGQYHSVLLIPDVSDYRDQSAVRDDSLALLPGLLRAVERWRNEKVGVVDPDRRALVRGLAGQRDPDTPVNPFGDPDELPLPKPDD
ncbi:MAG: [NiFe]-hydrogenase assembly chaperone HybE [Acidimicrobiia bacterium]